MKNKFLVKPFISIVVSCFLILFLSPLLSPYNSLSFFSSALYPYGRVDLFVTKSEHFSSLEITTLNEDKNTVVINPNSQQITNEYGQGAVLDVKQSYKSWEQHHIKLISDEECEVRIKFLGADKNFSNKRYPVYSEYDDIIVNGDRINDKKEIVWFENSFDTTVTLKKNVPINISFKVHKHPPTILSIFKDTNISISRILIILVVACSIGFAIGMTFEPEIDNENKSHRFVYFDIMRILAIFFVIYNHTAGYHDYLSYKDIRGIEDILHIALSVFTRFNVPLFFMISGALLLGKEENFQTILRKRVLRFAAVLLFFDLLCGYIGILSGQITSFGMFIRGIFKGGLPYTVPYWFLYSYLGLLILLPFVRAITKSLNKNTAILWFGIGVFICTLIPLFNLICIYLGYKPLELQGNFRGELGVISSSWIFYPVLGYYVDKKIELTELNKTKITLLIICLMTSVAIGVIATIAQAHIQGSFTQNYLGVCAPFMVVSLFILIKKASSSCLFEAYYVKKLITTLGPIIFFVYLLDIPLKTFIHGPIFSRLHLTDYPVISSLLWCLMSITILGMIGYILRKSSFVRKYI